MEALRQYIVSVVAAAILCGAVQSLVKKGITGNILKLVSGIFLAYTLLSPISGRRWESFGETILPSREAATQAAQLGEDAAREAMAQIIREQTRTYILEKAQALGVELEVEVILSRENVPQQVILRGSLSPNERRQLQSTIALDLGIPKENQQWSPSP